jgi:3-deoxy-D-manno-octulosonate 8-phosphate phosphatase (KDO 8-P phosphatase)
MTPTHLSTRAQCIELLLLDVDGVLTDGRLTYTTTGELTKTFHVRDGSALKFWQGQGKRVAIISGRSSEAVAVRAAELGIAPVIQNAKDKVPAYRAVLAATGLTAGQVCAVGDDLPDLPLLLGSGLSVAPADACPEVRAAVTHVVPANGGAGAVRAAIEWLMTLQGTWAGVVAGFRTAI